MGVCGGEDPGACYLIYLGWSQWRSVGNGLDIGHAQGAPALTWRQRVLAGFLTNATNPKGSSSWWRCCRSF
jgi:homoserine/homoserine lactone efflux protein